MYFHQFFQCIHSRAENKVQRIYTTNFFYNISNIVNKNIYIWLFIYFNTVWIKIFYIATNQAKYMFLEYSWNIPMIYYIFLEYLENVPYEIPGNIPWGIFQEYWIYVYSVGNVPGILNVGIFPECLSKNLVNWFQENAKKNSAL